MQTVITWTRYDGTPETLPKNGARVVVEAASHGMTDPACIYDGSAVYLNGAWHYAHGRSMNCEVGDWHAPWPAAPQGVE